MLRRLFNRTRSFFLTQGNAETDPTGNQEALDLVTLLLLILPFLGLIILLSAPESNTYAIKWLLCFLVLGLLLWIRSGYTRLISIVAFSVFGITLSMLSLLNPEYTEHDLFILTTLHLFLLFVATMVLRMRIFVLPLLFVALGSLLMNYLLWALPHATPEHPVEIDDYVSAAGILILATIMTNIILGHREKLFRRILKDSEEQAHQTEEINRQRTLIETLIQQSPIGMLMCKPDGEIISLNRSLAHLLEGETTGRLKPGMNIQEARLEIEYLDGDLDPVPPQDRPLARVLAGRNPLKNIFLLRSGAEDLAWVYQVASPVLDKGGRIIAGFSSFLDITEQRNSADALTASLREKEVLLQEIHHRVKNNLNIVIGLLRLQKGNITSREDAQDALEESVARIFSMALVHERLYEAGNFASIPFKGYLEALLEDLTHSYHTDHIQFRMQIEEIELGLQQAVPCGLIVNELLTNAMKHAFPDQRQGQVQVDLFRARDTDIQLVVRDDGVGSELSYWENPTSLGIQLITSLTGQLEGRIEVHNQVGTEVVITFPDPEQNSAVPLPTNPEP